MMMMKMMMSQHHHEQVSSQTTKFKSFLNNNNASSKELRRSPTKVVNRLSKKKNEHNNRRKQHIMIANALRREARKALTGVARRRESLVRRFLFSFCDSISWHFVRDDVFSNHHRILPLLLSFLLRTRSIRFTHKLTFEDSFARFFLCSTNSERRLLRRRVFSIPRTRTRTRN